MTVEELTALGIPLDMTDGVTALAVESGLAWLAQNTTFEFGTDQLPANVKLFLVKFVELMQRDTGVSSESIAGMSQSFSSEGTGLLLRQLAGELLSEWYKTASFTPAQRRWW